MGAPAAHAQDAAQAAAVDVEQIVVTGSRIVRDGYEAPTPVTVIGVEQFETAAGPNLADYVNTLPVFAGSINPTTTNATISNGLSGVNVLNLRALGGQRTLVLLDGQRTVGINLSQLVDINLMPQNLVSRVDIVTGGASAAYGSDALAGVVNFVLDKEYVGVKGEGSGGVTTYGDRRNWEVSLTAGSAFAGERGHFLVSGEASHADGIPVNDRDWNTQGRQFMRNPNYTATNGQPARLLLKDVGISNGISGGIISNTALRGTAFGPGGAPYQFTYGDLVSDPDMRGGDWAVSNVRGTEAGGGLISKEVSQNVFTRVSYDVTDNATIFAQAAWAHNYSYNWCCSIEDTGSIRIKVDNPFIPAPVLAQMLSLGVTQFKMGTMHPDLPINAASHERRINRYVIGANGSFDLFDDTEWTWDAYIQMGISHETNTAHNAIAYPNFPRAVDAVADPITGQPVCRVTLTDPTSTCLPYNPMGIGVNSPLAVDYVEGEGERNFRSQKYTQDVYAISTSGEPLSLWAGPVSLALGIEHRKIAVPKGINGERDRAFGWWDGNYQVTSGSVSVTEGFVETVVPLATDQDWARSLELNAAVRATEYSTSGFVTTWKVGATYAPIDDIRFRVTRSRDIRAPNMEELFSAGGGGSPGILNPFLGGITEIIVASRKGNPLLRPEKANTTGFGVVLQPAFMPGFSASIDYWNININDAIGQIGTQAIIDNCFEGNQDLCSGITFTTDKHITFVSRSPFNLVNQIARGLDIEASYRMPANELISSWPGDVALRFLATHYTKNYTSNGINTPTDTAGQNTSNGPPDWRWVANATYTNDTINANLTARGVSAGVYRNSNVQCLSSCPPSTSTNRTVNNNRIDGAVYFDASFAYKFAVGESAAAEWFFNVRNLTNKDPALVATGPGGYGYALTGANGRFYDVLGRVFRSGIRFTM